MDRRWKGGGDDCYGGFVGELGTRCAHFKYEEHKRCALFKVQTRPLELLLRSNDPSKNRGAGASKKGPAAPMTQIVAAMRSSWLFCFVESGSGERRNQCSKSHYFTPQVCVIFPAKIRSHLILLAQNLWDKPHVISLKWNYNYANIMVISHDNDPDIVKGHTK